MKNVGPAVLLAAGLFSAALSASAEEKRKEAPRPPAEVKKLGAFLGTWSNEAEVRPNAFLPPGRYTWTEKCDWYPGGFHLLCFSAGKGPRGATNGLAILFYKPEERAYVWWGIDDSGRSEASKGALNGNTWTFTSKKRVAGRNVRGRYSVTTLEASHTFKYETSKDGKTWTLVLEGKAKRPEKRVRPGEREREREREKPQG